MTKHRTQDENGATGATVHRRKRFSHTPPPPPGFTVHHLTELPKFGKWCAWCRYDTVAMGNALRRNKVVRLRADALDAPYLVQYLEHRTGVALGSGYDTRNEALWVWSIEGQAARSRRLGKPVNGETAQSIAARAYQEKLRNQSQILCVVADFEAVAAPLFRDLEDFDLEDALAMFAAEHGDGLYALTFDRDTLRRWVRAVDEVFGRKLPVPEPGLEGVLD